MRLYSGKHHRAGFNYQIICTLDGTLLVITGSATGTHHDAFAYQYHEHHIRSIKSHINNAAERTRAAHTPDRAGF